MYVICAYHKCVVYVISILIIIVALKCSLYKNVDFLLVHMIRSVSEITTIVHVPLENSKSKHWKA